LAREVWWYESTFPLSAIGYIAEPVYLRPYRHVPVVTVSASSSADLRQLGFKHNISVIREGIEQIDPQPKVKSTPSATYLFVGRLSPSKRVDDVIRAFAMFVRDVPHAELRIVGEGPDRYLHDLKRLASTLAVSERVTFLGRLSTDAKHEEMRRAMVLLVASAREGWGLVVTEANAFGTPAVAYDVAGLRDSIRHERTGLLVDTTPAALAGGMLRLWTDPELYGRLSDEAKSWSQEFSFDDSASDFRKRLVDAVGSAARRVETHSVPRGH
jgi:glycosyltransferase involved in cell wall biosynthesis